jgi:hypothetical protein
METDLPRFWNENLIALGRRANAGSDPEGKND